MTKDQEQAAKFWEDIHIDHHVHPYTIMFQVDDNCPVYMHNYKDWAEYFVAAYPSSTTTAFVVEEQMNIQHMRPMMMFMEIYDYAMDVILWDEHGGFTTA